MKEKKHYFFALIGSIAILAFYFGTLSLMNSIEHALSEFQRIWYFVLFLSAGFGVQIGLYFYMKNFTENYAVAASVAGTAGVSGTSMVACCLHHLTDLLPVLGLSALAFFLGKYQLTFMLIAVFSNLGGTIYMLSVIKKHNLIRRESRVLRKIALLNLDGIFKMSIAVGLALVVLSLIYFN
jgi:hypothetical protein